jgi:hypothetical protein
VANTETDNDHHEVGVHTKKYDCVAKKQWVLKNTPEKFQAGQIRNCYNEWRKLTSNATLLKTVHGYELVFETWPGQYYIPKPLRFNPSEQIKLDKALADLSDRGVIELVKCDDGTGFYSTVFPKDKRDGSVRVILNLSELNEFLEYHHFKMDTVKDAILLVKPNCYFASIDFKHAYFSVPIATKHRKFFQIYLAGSIVPIYLFATRVKPSTSHIHKIAQTCICYVTGKGSYDSWLH